MTSNTAPKTRPTRVFNLRWGVQLPGRKGRVGPGVVQVDPANKKTVQAILKVKGSTEITEQWWSENETRVLVEQARQEDEARALAEKEAEGADLFGPDPGDVASLTVADLKGFTAEELRVVIRSFGIQIPRRARRVGLLQIATDAVTGKLKPAAKTTERDPRLPSVEEVRAAGYDNPEAVIEEFEKELAARDAAGLDTPGPEASEEEDEPETPAEEPEASTDDQGALPEEEILEDDESFDDELDGETVVLDDDAEVDDSVEIE